MPDDPLFKALTDVREQFARLGEAKGSITIDHLPRGESWRYMFRSERDPESRFRSLSSRTAALLRRRPPGFVQMSNRSALDDELFFSVLFSFAGDKVREVGADYRPAPGVMSAAPMGPRRTLHSAETVAAAFIERWISELESAAIPEAPPDDFITQEAAADVADVSSKTIQRWIKAGHLEKRASDSRVSRAAVERVKDSLRKRRPRTRPKPQKKPERPQGGT